MSRMGPVFRTSQKKSTGRLPSEKDVSREGERKPGHTLYRDSNWCQAERDGKVFWDAEQLDRHPSRSVETGIASEPLCKRQPIVRTLCPRKGHRRESEAASDGRVDFDLDALMADQLDARPAILPPIPVTPEKRRLPDHKRMQEHADLARLLGGAALPLALLAQRTGTATADTGSIHDAQAPVSFSALLMGEKLLISGASQRPIGLESEVLARETACFPGQAHVRGCIA